MRILVTGGCGFIGSHLVDRLIEEMHEVVVVDNLSSGFIQNLNTAARFVEIDICDKTISDVFEDFRPELVYHLAAQVDVQKSINMPGFDANVNIIGSINILNQCLKYGVNKIVYASSAAIYGNPKKLPINENFDSRPISYYGLSKYTPESYIKVFSDMNNIRYTILRFANVYGERQSYQGEGGVISIFFNKYLNNETPIIYGDGTQTRDFIYVKDIVSANVLVMNKGDNEIFNVSTNTPVNINEIANKISRITKVSIEPIYRPAREGDIKDSFLDNTKMFKQLNWKPSFSIEQGLLETYKKLELKKTVMKELHYVGDSSDYSSI
ncbi:UDP-glucose 4-epimerase [Fontibacillus solani]|uniref:UDP-glucose 4-epimerase n=1 Tax=Fontibacillus solani TaxID=1572857 RepID=A0A7W3SVM0_9BACL|nr:NAD-dependent epimerase/dehydratase family protein [Fontibacillus solani]MBA9086783.1 UDP-glucose 4-epimerase [Fontibacillus solani]